MGYQGQREQELRKTVWENHPEMSESDVRWEAAYWLSVEREQMESEYDYEHEYLSAINEQDDWSQSE